MNTESFMKIVTDPKSWEMQSKGLRRTGDALWNHFMEAWVQYGKAAKEKDKAAVLDSLDAVADYLTHAQMFWGLALETAFKGIILKSTPGEIELALQSDGTGTIQSVEIKQFGVPMNKGHDLVALAGKVGLFTRKDNPIFKEDSDFRIIREILLHLTDTVRWSARYPAPLKSQDHHVKPQDLPVKIFGYFILDWLAPVLDHYIPLDSDPTRYMPKFLLDEFEALAGSEASETESPLDESSDG